MLARGKGEWAASCAWLVFMGAMTPGPNSQVDACRFRSPSGGGVTPVDDHAAGPLPALAVRALLCNCGPVVKR